jgi:flagellar biosynthesis protein FlhB
VVWKTKVVPQIKAVKASIAWANKREERIGIFNFFKRMFQMNGINMCNLMIFTVMFMLLSVYQNFSRIVIELIRLSDTG